MTPAGRLQKYLREAVERSGGHHRKVRWEGRRGCPDCFVWWDGARHAWIEIKAEGDRVSALQEREHRRMRESGLPLFIARTTDDIDRIVQGLTAPKVCG